MTDAQEQMLKHAAELSGVSFSEFVVGASVREAQEVLADQRYFVVEVEDWMHFNEVLDAPVTDLPPGLRRLADRPSVFE